ncbi:MAG: PP2C family protein-serine/threonine phosphatase [Actinomycetota bacterium]
MHLSLRYSVQSEIGSRQNNEDAAFAGPRLLALADGMGGHAAGEVAASLVLAALMPLNNRPAGDPVVALREAAAAGNAAIAHHGTEHPEHEGMGATLTAILFAGEQIGLVHVGDSRAYLVRNGSLTQLTKDDTLVQYLIDQGRLTTEQAWHHPRRSMVHKVLTGQDVNPFVELREAEPLDRYLICSDGLSDFVPEETIAEVMRLTDPQRCVSELIRLALREGSQDNVTCIVADVAEGDSGYNIALLTGAPGREATLVRN